MRHGEHGGDTEDTEANSRARRATAGGDRSSNRTGRIFATDCTDGRGWEGSSKFQAPENGQDGKVRPAVGGGGDTENTEESTEATEANSRARRATAGGRGMQRWLTTDGHGLTRMEVTALGREGDLAFEGGGVEVGFGA